MGKNKKNKKFNRQIFLRDLSSIWIRLVSLHVSQWGILIASVFLCVSLFMSWFSLPFNSNVYGAFSGLIGIHAWVLIFSIVFSLFLLLFPWKKQKIQFFLNNSITEWGFILFIGIILGISSINVVSILEWLEVISSELDIYNGVIVSIVWSIIYFISAVWFHYKESKLNSGIYLNESSSWRKGNYNWNKTKLPF